MIINKVIFIVALVLVLMLNTSYAQIPVCPDTERTVLNQFLLQFNTFPLTGGWTDQSSNCCTRDGIICNANGNVIEFEIGYGAKATWAIQIDFTPLTFLEKFTFNSPITFEKLSFANGIKNIWMVVSTFTTIQSDTILLPSLETILVGKFDESFLFNVSYPLPNLTSISTDSAFTIEKIEFNNNYPVLNFISFTQMKTNYTHFLSTICDLTNLTDLLLRNGVNFDPNEPIVFPSCFDKLTQLSRFTAPNMGSVMQPFPIFPDNTIEIDINDGMFSNIPETLPSKLLYFNCPGCFSLLPTQPIPLGWESAKELRDLKIYNNKFNGSIPDFLIQRLSTFEASFNYFNKDILKSLINVKAYSSWDLEGNKIDEEIPIEYYTRVNGSFINLQNNVFHKRRISTELYCNGAEYLFLENDGLLINSTSLSQEQGNFDICTTFTDPLINNGYIQPMPLSGGKFIINNVLSLARTAVAASVPFKTSMKSKISVDINNNNKNNENINNNLLGDILGSSSSGEFTRPFDPYEFFDLNFNQILLVGGNNQPLLLQCKLINWNGQVECLLNQTQIQSLNSSTYLHTIISIGHGVDIQYNVTIGQTYLLDKPVIEIVNGTFINTEGGVITIEGINFGDNSIDTVVEFINPKAPTEDPIQCKVSFKNDTMIICEVPSIAKEDNIILNTKVQVGSQVNEKDFYFTIEQSNVESNCYGPASNQECEGNGKCVNGYCLCNTGYEGIFCQFSITVKEDEIITPIPDIKEPTSKFEDEKSTADFKVSVVELREMNFKGQVVQTTIPTWSLESSQADKEYIYTSSLGTRASSNILVQGNKKATLFTANDHPSQPSPSASRVVVTMNLFQDSQIVEFANTSIQVDSGSIKYTVQIDGYPFTSSLNYLQVVFNIQALPSQPVVDACAPLNNSAIETDPNIADIKWLQMARGNSFMVGKILNRAIVDSKIVYSQFHHEVVGDNSVNIVANLPFFKSSATLDPNFSAMLDVSSDSKLPTSNQCDSGNTEKDNGWKIATGVSVGAAIALAAAIGGVILYKKHQTKKKFLSDINQKLQASQL